MQRMRQRIRTRWLRLNLYRLEVKEQPPVRSAHLTIPSIHHAIRSSGRTDSILKLLPQWSGLRPLPISITSSSRQKIKSGMSHADHGIAEIDWNDPPPSLLR